MVKTKWISTDGWRGYEQPVNAVVGASDTGMWEDSPAPSNTVDKELKKAKTILMNRGISSKIVNTKSSNVFMVKRWLVVPSEKVSRAKKILFSKLNQFEFLHGVD